MRLSKLLALFAVAFLIAATTAPASRLEGYWTGSMVREGASLPVSIDVNRSVDGFSAQFNSRTQRALGIPLRNVRVEAGKAHLELIGDTTTIVFDGSLAGDRFTGTFREGPASGTFAFSRALRVRPPYSEEDVRFQNADVTLAGTLLMPKGGGRHPAVVFLHGSGSEGRFASRFLADQMARRGIAALIYDKRGVGQSTGDWRKSDFVALADDAAAAIALLAARKDIAPDAIGVYGHSQGAMLGPLVASRVARVAFVISASGSAVPLHEAEVNSIVGQVRAKGVEGEELAAAQRFIVQYVDVLRTGEGWDELMLPRRR